jgi:enoyl-CoA hydratase/carnithine racemase
MMLSRGRVSHHGSMVWMGGWMDFDLGSKYLRFEQRGSVGYVTIDRPERRNAMTTNMYLGVRRAVRRLEDSADLAAIVLTGSGDTFCVGGDMTRTEEPGGQEALDTFGPDLTPFEAIRNCPKPVVAMVNGLCMGGGLILALASDVAVVSERARFRIPEVMRGITDSWYAAYVPAHVGVARARDLMLRSRPFDAHEAVAMGLVAQVVPHDELEAATQEVVGDLVRAAPGARAQLKRMLNAPYGAVDTMTFMATANDEGIEGFKAFVEKRSPNWVPEDFRSGRL